ncbi:MAG: DUF3108 domain-containing protein [Pseudomonadota bacterium]
MRALRWTTIATIALTAGSAAADATDTLTSRNGVFEAGFEVFVGGLRVARLESETAIDDARYRQSIAFETAGVLSWFVDGQSQLLAEGGFDDNGAIRAERFANEAVWNDEERSTSVRFDDEGRVTASSFNPPLDTTEREPVPEDLRRGPDPLSVVIAAATSLSDIGADKTMDTFDGKRALRFGWRCDPETETMETDAYAGPVVECAVEGEQVAGFHRKYSSSNFQSPRPARLWLAPVDDGRFHAPVKLLMQTQYGGLVANMTRVGPPETPTD